MSELFREFDVEARHYDRLVGANPGYHHHLALSVTRMGIPDGGRGLRLLDIGCGTGASTAALLSAAPHAEIVAVDGSAQMLAQARAKTWPSSVSFLHSSLERLDEAGVNGPFDGILAAYLLRNLADADVGLAILRDLLRDGGILALHEYSIRDSRKARLLWNTVCWSVIIPLGKFTTGSGALYRYLWRSVHNFDGLSDLQNRIRSAGFNEVSSADMSGWQRHIVHTVLGRRRDA